MIKYEAIITGEIRKLEIKKETDKFIVFEDGRRAAKKSDWCSYFNTFEEAKQWLIAYLDMRIQKYQSSLDQAKRKKQRVDNMVVEIKE